MLLGSVIQILVVLVYRLTAYTVAQEHLRSDMMPFLVQPRSV